MTKISFVYGNGVPLKINDKVLINQDRLAKVEKILHPGTRAAMEYSSPDGGFVIVFDDGDVQVWTNVDEDIELVERGKK